MIVDKNNKPLEPEINSDSEVTAYQSNALCDVFEAVKDILLQVTYDPTDPTSKIGRAHV